ncbi:Non-structural maintenance of chromosomes element 1 [Merluccius polli]|uniref:Non-structural maintenance of chromosomes element 1 homolog n=1 Tax=Merluccius polli TaxID=89951 RepID=A0AA47NDM3_MERPO|nr:Non-structural maintenance of chromosomes element 1 [Merluccius polli]
MMAGGILSHPEAKALHRHCCQVHKEHYAADKLDEFIDAINAKLEPMYMSIRKGSSEDDGMQYYALVNTANTELTRMSSDYADNELELFRRTLDLIMSSDSGTASSTDILNSADTLQTRKLTKSAAEGLLKRLVLDGWLIEKQGDHRLSTRCIMEMEAYIRTMYEEQVKVCSVCHCLAFKCQMCANPLCTVKIHYPCAAKYFKSKPVQKCPGCSELWPDNVPGNGLLPTHLCGLGTTGLEDADLSRAILEDPERDDEPDGTSEPGVEQGIDERVEGGVDVDHPGHDAPERITVRGVLLCQHRVVVGAEARQEHQDKDTQRPGRLALRLPVGPAWCRCSDLQVHGTRLRHGHHQHPQVQHRDDGARPNEGGKPAGAGQVVLEDGSVVEHGGEPAEAHARLGALLRHHGVVVQRVADGHIAVDGDQHHVAHRGGGEDEGHQGGQGAHLSVMRTVSTGITSRPTSRSDTARESSSRLVGVCSVLKWEMEMTTSRLSTTVSRAIEESTIVSTAFGLNPDNATLKVH